MIFIISLFCAFLFFFILFFLLGHALKKKQVVSERLQQYADYLDVKETEEERISTGQKLRLPQAHAKGRGEEDRFEARSHDASRRTAAARL